VSPYTSTMARKRQGGAKSGRRRPVSLFPAVAYVVSGFIGGTAGLVLAMDAFRRDRRGPGLHTVEMAWIPPLATMVPIVAGVLVAWFVTALILSRAPGGERCPRCGSFNRRGVVACGACGLPLAGGLFRRAPQDA
jgi:hypothetical protein